MIVNNMDRPFKVLIIDDEKRFTEELSEFLRSAGFEAFQAHTARQGMSLLKKELVDLIVLDVKLPGTNGLDILLSVKEKYPVTEVIIVSAHGDMDTVIKALRNGAIDYLRKPFRHIDIRIAIERTRRFLSLNKKLDELEEKYSLISDALQKRIKRRMIGVSPQMKVVLKQAIAAAEFPNANVLITGESGTGKENIARIIHYGSIRKENVFLAVNSSAITESLMESEFFGHRKGSFTGAFSDRKGFFEVTDRGTLFLDEIADMPLSLQAKMLRALEDKTITPVGDTKPINTDFRVIAATNHDIDLLIDTKKFRLDLLHRLNTITIHIPPLRERPEDIEPLMLHFAESFAESMNKPIPGIGKDVLDKLKNYEFPGNVRELKNLVERAIILSNSHSLTSHDFPVKHKCRNDANARNNSLNLENNEAELIRLALFNSGNNRTEAARLLGIQRMALTRKMEKYNIGTM